MKDDYLRIPHLKSSHRTQPLKRQGRPMRNPGYTLIELVVVIGVMVVIISAGMAVFYQSLRSGAQIDFELFMDSSSRVITNSMSNVIEFGRVIEVDGDDQDDCLDAGAGGVTGDNMAVEVNDMISVFELDGDNNIASRSSSVVQVNPDGLIVNDLVFTWICLPGVKERVTVSFQGQAEKDGEPVDLTKDYSFDLFVRNSGYY